MGNDLNRHSAARRAFAGFTLVETLVALVIGMLATVIVMQVFAISEGQKRTITGGADAQSDGAVVLYLMERDLRQAGYGLSSNPEDFIPANTAPQAGGVLTNGILAQCTVVRARNSNRATTVDFVYAGSTFAPVVINPPGYPAGDVNTDLVLVNYGASGGMIGKGVPLTGQSGTTQAGGNVPDYRIDTTGDPRGRAQFRQGDMILAVPAPASGLDCTIGEITGFPESNGDCIGTADPSLLPPPTSHMVLVNHNDVAYANYYTGCANPTNATWNQPGAGVAYNAGSRLYNLGPVGSFVSRVYAVRNSNLTICDLTINDCTAAVADPPDANVWTPVANGVVGLKAQYGRDTNFDGTIDAWDTSTQLGALRAQVAAVRLAVAVRSGQYEKVDVTAAAPAWQKDATATVNASFDVSGSGSDWQRFRYKTAQSIVPVRNMIWGQQN